jgi:hypothetical protein
LGEKGGGGGGRGRLAGDGGLSGSGGTICAVRFRTDGRRVSFLRCKKTKRNATGPR